MSDNISVLAAAVLIIISDNDVKDGERRSKYGIWCRQ